MTGGPRSPEAFGRDVLGPVVAEFCLRLWSFATFVERSDDATLLFCARGGLRMHLAYRRFLAATGLPAPLPSHDLMVSRLAAVRPALMITVADGLDHLAPVAASALGYEFRRATVAGAARAVSGTGPATARPEWDRPFHPDGFAALLRHPDGEPVRDAVAVQADLFTRHVAAVTGGRTHAALVDTGLYGTTHALMAEGLPGHTFSSPLLARSFRPGPRRPGSFGVLVEAHEYQPWRRRTALLRYWHFVEWLFEPDLPSVRTFSDPDGAVRSNLETPGWSDRVDADPGEPFAGVLEHLDGLGPGAAEEIVRDAGRAWRELYRTIVWPRPEDVPALAVGARSHDFGLDGTWSARSRPGPLAALRGSTMWREGEIASSATWLRRPLLALLEGIHGARSLRRSTLRLRDRR